MLQQQHILTHRISENKTNSFSSRYKRIFTAHGCPTCSAEGHEGLGVFPEDLLGGRVDLQLGQEVLDEVVRRD